MRLFTRKTIAVHDGSFHADEVFACATLLMVPEFKNARIIRTRDETRLAKADIVLDVGGIYDPNQKRFDHHQKETAGVRANGILYATFGLIWKEYGPALVSNALTEKIDTSLVQGIDANDTGTAVYTLAFEDVGIITIQDIIASFRPFGDTSDKALDRGFKKAVAFAKRYLKFVITSATHQEEVTSYLIEASKKSPDPRYVVCDHAYSRHDLTIAALSIPEVLYVIYPGGSDKMKWNIVGARISMNSMETKKPFPSEWAGLRDKDLQEVSGIKTAVFCHNARFLAVVETKDDAIALAQKALIA